MTVSAFNGTSVFLLHVICRRLWKNALTADGCWWHAQHGLCHRTKNRITRLMLWPVATNAWDKMCGLSAAVPRTDQLQLYRVTSLGHVGRSRSASRVKLCPNRRLWRCCQITWRSSGGVVAFYRRSRLSMFAHDIYSGTNGILKLTPFVGVDSNAVSLNLGSITVATQVRSRDVTAFAN